MNSNKDITRRTAIRTVAGGAVSGSFAGVAVGQASAGSTGETEITYALASSDDPDQRFSERKKRVPTDWYEDLQRTNMVHENSDLTELPGVVEFDVLPPKYGGRNARLRVGVAVEAAEAAGFNAEDAVGEIPSSVHGVKTEIERVGIPTTDACYDTNKGSTVPAGAIVKKADGSYGSLSAAMYSTNVYQPDGNFATSQHIWADKMYPSGYKMYHPTADSTAIGDIYTSDCELDFVIASGINGHSPTSNIVGTNLTVTEQYTQDGIADLVGQGASATKRGVRTCETSGEIKTANGYIGVVDKGCGTRGHQVKGTWNSNDGDSGCTVYRDIGGGEASALSMHGGKDPLANGNGFGFGAYWLSSEGGFSYVN